MLSIRQLGWVCRVANCVICHISFILLKMFFADGNCGRMYVYDIVLYVVYICK